MPKAKSSLKLNKSQGKKLAASKRQAERKEFVTETGIFIRADQPHEWTRSNNHIYWRYLYHIRQAIQNLENLFVEEKDEKYLFEVKHWQRIKDLLIYEGRNYDTITLEEATINASSTNYNERLAKKPKQPRARPLWIDTTRTTAETETKTLEEESTSQHEDDSISLYLTSNPSSPTPSPVQPSQGKSPDHPIEL
jgi:hypothetical protein